MPGWDGIERRETPHCMHHSAVAQSLEILSNMKPVPFSVFKWAIGIVMLVVLALFVIPLTQLTKNKEILHDIHIEQTEVKGSVNALTDKLDTWIEIQDKRITGIEQEIILRHQIQSEN